MNKSEDEGEPRTFSDQDAVDPSSGSSSPAADVTTEKLPSPASLPATAGAARELSGAAFLGMGLTVAMCVAAGTGIGYWLDTVTHHSSLFLLLGMALGLVSAVASAVALLRRITS